MTRSCFVNGRSPWIPRSARGSLPTRGSPAARARTIGGCCGGCDSRDTTSIVGSAVRTAAYGVKRLDDIDLTRALAPDVVRDLDRDAPETLAVPSGRHHRLEYNDDGTVSARP